MHLTDALCYSIFNIMAFTRVVGAGYLQLSFRRALYQVLLL